MFNNLITVGDFIKVAEKLRHGGLGHVVGRLMSQKRDRVIQTWEHTKNPPTNWSDIPSIKKRWNLLISGDSAISHREYISHKYFGQSHSIHALSLACGKGVNELAWADTGKFKNIDAYDLSESRVNYARKKLMESDHEDVIHYAVADVYNVDMPEDFYDAVLAEQSLHHFSPLDKLLLRVSRTLKKSGYFIVNEFVGPSRFQWTDRQLDIINCLLSIIPLDYRVKWESSCIKSRVYRPGRLSMVLNDPSEAVESSKILPLLEQIFDVVEVRGYGGTILHMLFSNIAHNFLCKSREAERLLKLCFETEDILLERGDIRDDFVIAICKKKT